MRVLITGCHGFIGFSLALRLLQEGHTVIGIDRPRDARHDKGPRINLLQSFERFTCHEIDLSDYQATHHLLGTFQFDHLVHLAGQYSVAYSTPNLLSFIDGNLRSFLHVMDCARLKGMRRVVYASSTFVMDDQLPRSMYGATLEFRERAAHVYSDQFGIETVGLRFGSTYGPHIRPDVGVYQIIRKLVAGEPIKVDEGGFKYTSGMLYIDDAVDVLMACLGVELKQKHNVFTVVAHERVASLTTILALMEKHTGLKTKRIGQTQDGPRGYTPTVKLQPLKDALGFVPSTTLEVGIQKFCDWYLEQRP